MLVKVKIVGNSQGCECWYANRIGDIVEVKPYYHFGVETGDWVGHNLDGSGKDCLIAWEDAETISLAEQQDEDRATSMEDELARLKPGHVLRLNSDDGTLEAIEPTYWLCDTCGKFQEIIYLIDGEPASHRTKHRCQKCGEGLRPAFPHDIPRLKLLFRKFDWLHKRRSGAFFKSDGVSWYPVDPETGEPK